MENDVFALHIEAESLVIGEVQIKGGSFDFSTADEGIADKLMYLTELFSSIFAMNHYSNKDEKEKGESL